MSPSTIQIESSGTRASIETRGASLISLEHGNHDYCPEFTPQERLERYVGSVIAPWANRIADGRYQRGDEVFQLPVNEAGRNNALHGFSGREDWKVDEVTDSGAKMSFTVQPTSGYPHRVELSVSYLVGDGYLTIDSRAVVTSHSPAPFGWALHPYFRVGPGAPKEWLIQTPASQVMEVDSARLLPRGVVDVNGRRLDFTKERHPDDGLIDHAFTNWGEHEPSVQVRDPLTGRCVALTWSANLPWLQIHVPNAEDAVQGSIVVEPQTSPPDSFNSGIDLTVLAPGEEWQATCRIDLT